jgi:glutathione S-transferase
MKKLRLVIGNKNYSFWSLSPWLLLKMHNVDFEEIRVGLYQADTAEKLGPYSPSLKVPVLLDKEITVWDSLAICEYISAEILNDSGWPAHTRKRASARSVCGELHGDFPSLKRECPFNCKAQYKTTPSSQTQNEIARIEAIWSCCRHKFGENGQYLYGRFSIADCMYAPMAIVFQAYGARLGNAANLYVRTITSNPFVQNWIAAAKEEKESPALALASSM